MLKIIRKIAEIIEKTVLAFVSGRYIFSIHASMRPPSRLATGNKFKLAYIILVINANINIVLFPAPCIITKVKAAASILKIGPPSAIKISVL